MLRFIKTRPGYDVHREEGGAYLGVIKLYSPVMPVFSPDGGSVIELTNGELKALVAKLDELNSEGK